MEIYHYYLLRVIVELIVSLPNPDSTAIKTSNLDSDSYPDQEFVSGEYAPALDTRSLNLPETG